MTISLSDISWIDSVFRDGFRHLGIFFEEDVTVVVKIPDDRSGISLLAEFSGDLWNCEGCSIIIDRDAYELRARIGELDDLRDSRIDIASRSIGHRLDHDRMF